MAANTLMIFVKSSRRIILDEVWNPQDYVDAMTAENEQKALEFSAQKRDFKD